MAVEFIQAYMTTDYPDDNGNYFYPIFIPENARVSLPVVSKSPDPSLGNRGLRYDWSNDKWVTSDQDPLINKVDNLEAQLQVLTGQNNVNNNATANETANNGETEADNSNTSENTNDDLASFSQMTNLFNNDNSNSTSATSAASSESASVATEAEPANSNASVQDGSSSSTPTNGSDK